MRRVDVFWSTEDLVQEIFRLEAVVESLRDSLGQIADARLPGDDARWIARKALGLPEDG